MTGAASLFGVVLQPVPEAAVKAAINSLRYFGHGASWGGFESLVTYPKPERVRSATRWQSGPLLRLHIGLEDPADLIADLEAATNGCAPPRVSGAAPSVFQYRTWRGLNRFNELSTFVFGTNYS